MHKMASRATSLFLTCLILLWSWLSPFVVASPQLVPRRRLHVSTEGGAPLLLSTNKIRGGEAAWQSGIKNSIASALAAATSKLLLAPLDTIKTLQQSQRASGQATLTVLETARLIAQRPKGFLELYVS
jgi:hypothetical protein